MDGRPVGRRRTAGGTASAVADKGPPDRERLAALARRLEQVLAHRGGHGTAEAAGLAGQRPPIAPRWLAPWRIARGYIHEWLSDDGAEGNASARPPAMEQTVAPLCLLVDTAWAAIGTTDEDAESHAGGSSGGMVVWIGRRVWPHPRVMARGWHGDVALMARSLLVAARAPGERLWAIELALRCPAVALVIADGEGLSPVATRRLQLAAEAAEGLVLLARPWCERTVRSAAATRWRVQPQPTDAPAPCWAVTLWRARPGGLLSPAEAETGDAPTAAHPHGAVGSSPASSSAATWIQRNAFQVQWHEEDGLIPVSTRLAGRSHPPPQSRPAGTPGSGDPTCTLPEAGQSPTTGGGRQPGRTHRRQQRA